MRKCLTVKGSLQDIQKGGCSLVSKYACVNLVCPIPQCVNEVYHEQEAASCVSGITWHVYLRLW